MSKAGSGQYHLQERGNRFYQKFVEHRQIDGGKRHIIQIERNGVCRENC